MAIIVTEHGVEKLIRKMKTILIVGLDRNKLWRGARAIVEDSLNSSCVWIPCRQHVLEIVLSCVFSIAFELVRTNLWHWNEATKPERAVVNDVRLLQQDEAYPNCIVKNIRLALFDSRVSISTNIAMIKIIQHPSKHKTLKRLESKSFNHDIPLERYVTQRTTEPFDILLKNSKEKPSSVHSKEPVLWPTDQNFVDFKIKHRNYRSSERLC
ncbi:hypothetical protein J6590_091688 [Homalodisca vitripennis]|nr:hypothetical protein J6590_091688 [Homalodisca vitripennis]